MIYVTFYLLNPKAAITPIYARVFPGDFRNSTHISIEPKYWALTGKRKSKGAVVNAWLKSTHPYAIELNRQLRELNNRIHSIYFKAESEGQPLEELSLAEIIRPGATKKGGEVKKLVTVRDYYEDWGKWYRRKKNRGDAEGPVGKDYVRGYKQIVDKIHEYAPKVKPKDITLDWIEDFEEWLHGEYTLQDNTLLRYRKVYRLVRRRAGLPFDFIETGSMRKSDKFDLWWSEVQQLYTYNDYSSPEVAAAAHATIINCQLGLRWGDLQDVRPEQFYQVHSKKHGAVTVLNRSQSKTADDILIPVPPLAAELLEKYNWWFPVPRTKKGTAYRDKFAELQKLAAEEAGLKRKVRTKKVYNGKVTEGSTPLHKKISTHIPRHTAGTLIEKVAGRELASVLLGHAEGGVTHNYIHKEQIETVDTLLDAWQKIEQQYKAQLEKEKTEKV